MTLLFALFVVLFSLASVKTEQLTQIQQTLTGLFVTTVDASQKASSETEQTETAESPQPESSSALPVAEPAESIEATEQQNTNSLLELESELSQNLRELTDSGLAKIHRDGDWLYIELNSSLLFGSGSATANNSAKAVMETLSVSLLRQQNFIRVRGYTDALPIHNELFSSNWELSVARATAILRLLENNGVQPARMVIEGYGQYAPFADNSTNAGRAENRKVVLAISNEIYKTPATKPQPVSQPSVGDNEAAEPQVEDKIRVIRLPHGGIRITTRAPESGEAEEPLTKQGN